MKLLMTIFIAFLAMGTPKNARKANKAYRQGNYKQAIELYKKAINAEAKNPKLYFNLANALAKNGQKKEAIRYYEQYKQMTNKPDEQARADYNIGNIYSEQKQWGKAAESYKKSMRGASADLDSKHNYELARQHQKKKQQKKNKNKNKKKSGNKNKKKKNKQKKKNDQDKKKKNRDNKSKDKNKSQQNKQKNKNQKKQAQPSKISKKEAQNILKALAKKEKNLLKQFKKHKTKSTKKQDEKDW